MSRQASKLVPQDLRKECKKWNIPLYFGCMGEDHALVKPVIHWRRLREKIEGEKLERVKFKPAIICGHLGLRDRAVDYYPIGMKVKAYLRPADKRLHGNDKMDAIVRPAQFGESSILPVHCIKFT